MSTYMSNLKSGHKGKNIGGERFDPVLWIELRRSSMVRALDCRIGTYSEKNLPPSMISRNRSSLACLDLMGNREWEQKTGLFLLKARQIRTSAVKTKEELQRLNFTKNKEWERRKGEEEITAKKTLELLFRGAIACLLRNKGWEVHEVVHCIAEDDFHRRADIIGLAINRQQQKAIVIDPTIRMERDLNQAHHVDHEKWAIYEPCIPHLNAKYNIPLFNWSVTENREDGNLRAQVRQNMRDLEPPPTKLLDNYDEGSVERRKNSLRHRNSNPGFQLLRADALSTKPHQIPIPMLDWITN
ncbi:hypothetical protein ANN_14426 [Periplaneta americana]|uniref:Uncharacterized protein n=1 Tax=Periplaneta americana TaxID=6978 RepID=A0ABQ8SXM5_PERAM|nr:hypothetical protein ANN_14426 [Periplaneta americana]